jgi:hypothetical protein
VLAPVAITGGLAASLPNLLYLAVLGSAGVDPASMVAVGTLAGIYAVALVAAAVQIYTQLTLFLLVRRVMDGERPGIVESFRAALRLRWLGTLALKYLVYAASGCFCGLPLLYFGLVLAPLNAVLVHEDTAWGRALARCIRLCHFTPRTGGTGHTIVRIVVAWHAIVLVMWALGGTTALPSAIVGWFDAWRNLTAGQAASPLAAGTSPLLSVPLALLSAVGWSVAGLYPVILFTLLFRDVRDASEGHDLAAALDARLGGDGR